MKVEKINFINPSPKKFENKTKLNLSYSQFGHFSSSYCSAIKSKNLAFMGNMSELDLKQRCDELKKQLLSEGVIESEEEISWYTDKYANEANITIAKKVFSKEHLRPCAHDILTTTNEENLTVASYICDRPFPLNRAFDVLVNTNKDNARASLAMCISEDIPKDVIAEILPYVKEYNDGVIAKIALDKNYPSQDKVRSFTALQAHNSAFVEELMDDKDFPRDNILYLIGRMQNIAETKARQEFYRFLCANFNDSKEDIEEALCKINAFNEKFIRNFYSQLQSDGKLNLEQINYASSNMHYNHDAYKKIKAYEALVVQEDFSAEELSEILKSISADSLIQKGLKFLQDYPDFPSELKVFALSNDFALSKMSSLSDREKFYNLAQELNEVYKKLMANPDLYINGEADSEEEAREEIREYVGDNFSELIKLIEIFDKNTLEFVFRKRLDNVDGVIQRFVDLEEDSLGLLKEILKAKNKKGIEFSSKEKLALLNILAGYEACNADMSEIKTKGRIDIEELEQNLLKAVFQFCGMREEEIDLIPKEIISKWDIDYAHLLALQERTFFEDGDWALSYIIRAVNLGKDFKSYIQGDNLFGTVNFATKEKFKNCGLNYENWLNPLKECEVQFKYIDTNQERLAQIVSQIEEDIETLRKTPAKAFIDKHFSDCIIGEKFKINEKYSKNKQILEKFIKNMFELLDRNIFVRAQINLNNPDKKKNAQTTLTIKNHLEQRLKDISQCETKKKDKPIDLTIKMWDRNPTHDLFQGNYSTCCIGLGEANGVAMPTYLLSTMFNMIELVDNKTGETMGNALCYFAVDEYNEPKFIIDNIEIANKYKMSDSASEKLLNEIIGYCINLLKTISGKNIPILMGTNYNDVYDEDITTIELDYLKALGEMDYEMTYLDAFNGWSEGEFDSNYLEKSLDDTQETDKLELFYLADSR